MIAKKLILSIIIMALAPSSLFAANATDILHRAETADQYINYRGKKTASVLYDKKTVSAVIKVVHTKPDNTRTEYYSPAPLAGIVMIQDGPNLWKYTPRSHAWEQVRSSALMPYDDNRRGAFDNYDIQLIGTDKVAGRNTYVIREVPKQGKESVHRIWVDTASYVILGTQVINWHGAVVTSSRYTSVEINPKDISPSVFAITGKVKGVPKPGNVDFHVAKPSYLPKGYRMVGKVGVVVSDHCCVHSQFSNGINSISLFQRKCGGDAAPKRLLGKATTVLTWARAGMLYTLIGDIPRAELQKVADSIR